MGLGMWRGDTVRGDLACGFRWDNKRALSGIGSALTPMTRGNLGRVSCGLLLVMMRDDISYQLMPQLLGGAWERETGGGEKDFAV